MNRALLLVCLIGASWCQSASVAEPKEKEKGFIDWINNLLGGSSTTTSPIISNDPPPNCPACRK